ncbi:bacteriohemerythrin [Terasakiella sp. A23]|uniref:bacteriohemerythrin n=1 Tax=Terasakiella sp. FCG-A23 TaxID=3080561 RepID=UPI002955BFFE|nr:bacteriohemerythrin [Terasakiella sp. A23]MDV7340571.1 bacteriohemerythrin [Terasakiella sp. A23]
MSRIKKSKLANGVFWLEFPDADLRILCGCPADAVKHMMKRGVIIANEASPVFHESGPNAILLSDLTVQKGSFANLGEFPVLQMLYRQGMILPEHPGNTGVKPLLMGHPDQLAAQIQYIHRGNYGLLNEEEIIEAGASPEQAKELMRLKLKFAFGKIANSEELLDSLVIDSDATPIRNGVSVKRIATNIFEFDYMGEQVTVDLNLGLNEQYTPSYHLGRYQVGREYFSIVHSGEGDGWDIERPSMASIITFQGNIYLIDVGPNIETTLHALGIDISEIDGIFMTHCHDDHFAGLPSLIRSDHRIKFYATPLVRQATVKKLCALMALDESRFNHFFDVHNLDDNVWNNVEGLEVKPVISPHPMETTILFFRTQWGGGYKTYAHLADIAAFDVMEGMVTDDDQSPGISREYCNAVKEAYLEEVDIKKVDNGGGLIHGMAKDFFEDKSRKIIFAHTSRQLNEQERQIGSGAPFGTEDVLIPSNHDYLFARAFSFMRSFFPDLPQDQFRLLLNHEVVKFNPEEIILKDGDPIDYTYFLLTGSAEMLDTKTSTLHRMSAGCFVGDMQGLCDMASTETYRAVSFVKALKLPMAMYKEFVKRNDSFQAISMLAEKRELLQKSWLFGGSISDGRKNAIAASMHVTTKTELLHDYETTRDYVGLIKQGTVTLKLGDEVFQVLEAGDSLFEDHAVYGMESIFNLAFSEHCAIALIPIATIKEVPVVQWKLLENVARQMRALANSDDWDHSLLTWRREYSVGLNTIDEDHKKLLVQTADLINALDQQKSAEEMVPLAQSLSDYTHFHFKKEEKIFTNANYSESDTHKQKHAQLVAQVEKLQEKCAKPLSKAEANEIIRFLKRWILLHILLEDRKYASYITQSDK